MGDGRIWLPSLALAAIVALAPYAPPLAAAEHDLSEYFPGQPGDSWVYQGEGSEFASLWTIVQYRSEDRIQMATDNGGTVVGAVYRITPSEITRLWSQAEWYEAQDMLSQEFADPPRIVLSAPLEVGRVWTNSYPGRIETREIEAVGTTLSLPVGEVHDVVRVKVTHSGFDSVTYESYARGWGLLERTTELADGFVVRSSLAEYRLAAQAAPPTSEGTP